MKRILKAWLPVLLWAAIIFFFSSNPDPYKYLPESWRYLVPIRAVSDNSLAEWIGQVMHFIEYAVLAFLLSRALFITRQYKIPSVQNLYRIEKANFFKILTPQHLNSLIAVLLSMLYALSDETHQIFVPGRAFQVIDLIIDFIGSITGMWIWKMIRKRGS